MVLVVHFSTQAVLCAHLNHECFHLAEIFVLLRCGMLFRFNAKEVKVHRISCRHNIGVLLNGGAAANASKDAVLSLAHTCAESARGCRSSTCWTSGQVAAKHLRLGLFLALFLRFLLFHHLVILGFILVD